MLFPTLRVVIDWILRAFFREVEFAGLRSIPTDRGGLIVSWHPNGLVDPALILVRFPGEPVFGARHGLFRWPILGWVMRRLGTVPIYRAIDLKRSDRRTHREANQLSLSAMARRIAGGSYSAIFPEGISHDEPHPVALKTGVARTYYRALELLPPGAKPPVIIPVGLHYDRKRVFRSSALVWFHTPLVLPDHLARPPCPDDPPQLLRERVRELTELIERSLHDVVHATEDWETHYALHRVRTLVRAERLHRSGKKQGQPDVREKTVAFARIRAAYYNCLTVAPTKVAALRRRVEQYGEDLRALGLEDEHLDQPPSMVTYRLALLLGLQALVVYFLMPPLLLVGYAVNGPPALLILAVSRRAAGLAKDVATLKILLGCLVFPLVWIATVVLGARAHERLRELFPALPEGSVAAGVTLALLAIVGGMFSLRYLHLARRTARALRVRLTRARRGATLERLRVERSALHDAIFDLVSGIESDATQASAVKAE